MHVARQQLAPCYLVRSVILWSDLICHPADWLTLLSLLLPESFCLVVALSGNHALPGLPGFMFFPGPCFASLDWLSLIWFAPCNNAAAGMIYTWCNVLSQSTVAEGTEIPLVWM